MNTRVPAGSAWRNASLEWCAMLSPIHVESAALLLICTTLAVGAFLSFPLYDDGWLALVLRESGPHVLAQYMGDRPIFGFLLEHLSSFGAGNRAVYVFVNSVLWVGLAAESGILFRRLFPEFKDYAIVAICLTLAPIVLQTQLSTAMVSLPANLATILGYAAVLILLQDIESNSQRRPSLLGLAAVLAMSGVALSEYGVATNLVGCALLLGLGFISPSPTSRRQLFLHAAGLFAVTGTSYLLFAKMADFSVRPDIAPSHMLGRGMFQWMELPFAMIAGTWHAIIGAYAAALGNITVAWDSKSTVIGIVLGLLMAILLCSAVRRRRVLESTDRGPSGFASRWVILLAAILVGLLPFNLMGRATTLLEFGSRFRIPIMPVAAAMTVSLALYLVRPSFRWVVVAIFGIVIGYASWTFAYTAVQRSRAVASFEKALKPYVQQSNGFTVAVVPFNRFESELTANIASTWPLEIEKRLWVVGEEPARMEFGDRSTCVPSTVLDIHARRLERVGELNQILWVEAPPGKPVSIQQYCHTSN